VSEPDKITLYGTLNFVRRLNEVIDQKPDIRLVFNKVVPAFSVRFLERFYEEHLKFQFDGRELLAIYPLEIRITKEFEKTPFITTVYPTSQLAEKTRLLLYRLLGYDGASRSSRTSIFCRADHLFHWYYMGRWPRFLDPEFALKIIAIAVLMMFGSQALSSSVERTNNFVLKNLLSFLPAPDAEIILFMLIGLAYVTGLNWARNIDVFLTYHFRTHEFVAATVGCGLFALICLPAFLLADWAIGRVVSQDISGLEWSIPLILVIIPLLLVISYFKRALRNIFYESRYVEGAFRIAFAFGMPTASLMYFFI